MKFLIHFTPTAQRSKDSIVRMVERGKGTQNVPQFGSVEHFLQELQRRFPEVRAQQVKGNRVWLDVPGNDMAYIYKTVQAIADAFFVELHRF